MSEGQSPAGRPPTGGHAPCLVLPRTQLWDAWGGGFALLGMVRETNTVISTLTCPER